MFLTGVLLLGFAILFFTDPVIEREVSFDLYSVKYEWRIFNNAYCNIKTAEHCFTNATNKTNAEGKLCLLLLQFMGDSKTAEVKLEQIVLGRIRFKNTYAELTKTNEIILDSLQKHKQEIFKTIRLK